MNIQGCGTALITPFSPDGSSVDEQALTALVQWQIESGIDFLVPCGTTGEASTLTEAEWLRTVEVVLHAAAGRVPVFAGCTHNSTAEAVARVQKLARIPGLTGILTANPYYSKPSQEGQFQHFKAVADAALDITGRPLPILLYNIPGRSGANLEPATVLRLAQVPNIIGIKESSGNLIQITELLTQLPRTFHVFCGDDALTLPVLSLGGAGLISVASNVIPGEMAHMVGAALANDWPTARRINRKFFALMQANFIEPSPAPVKAFVALLGRCSDSVRLPIVAVTPATRRKLETLAGELGLLVHLPPSNDNLRMF